MLVFIAFSYHSLEAQLEICTPLMSAVVVHTIFSNGVDALHVQSGSPRPATGQVNICYCCVIQTAFIKKVAGTRA